ncbi:MAG: hypothetical protein ACUVWP_08510 [bacterium]
MVEDYHKMWQELGLDMEKHDLLVSGLGKIYPKIFLSQANRPKGMAYFDNFIIELHGGRVKELVEHKKKGW